MSVGRTPDERFYQLVTDLQNRVNQLEAAPLQIPMVDTDPPTTYKGNIWMFADGRLHLRLPNGTIKEYTSISTTGSASATAQPTIPPQPVAQFGFWDATWTQAYKASGGITGGDSRYLYYGNSHEDGGFNGKQTSLIGFNYAAIQTALAGSVINKVTLQFYNVHTYPASGTTLYFGMHNNSSQPGSLTGLTSQLVSSDHINRASEVEHQISTAFGANIRDGVAKGVVLQAPNDTQAYYGYAAGIGSGKDLPRLRVWYTK